MDKSEGIPVPGHDDFLVQYLKGRCDGRAYLCAVVYKKDGSDFEQKLKSAYRTIKNRTGKEHGQQ